jgi:hypothetical protein
MNRELVFPLLGRKVQVEIEGFKLQGTLSFFTESLLTLTPILVLFNGERFFIIKGHFDSLGEIKHD